MTFHRVLTAYSIRQMLLILELLKRYCFPFVPDFYQVPKAQVILQVGYL